MFVYWKIKRIDKCKYSGKWIQTIWLDKEANEGRARKIELVPTIVQNRYVQASELLQSKYKTLQYGYQGRKSIRKERNIILPEKGKLPHTWRKRENEDLYRKTEKILRTIRKRGLKFYVKLAR